MLGSAGVDLTQIIVTLITTLPAIIAALFARRIQKQIKTPSGDTLGQVAERTHENTVATVTHLILSAKNSKNGTEKN
jgi:cobalamin synthase